MGALRDAVKEEDKMPAPAPAPASTNTRNLRAVVFSTSSAHRIFEQNIRPKFDRYNIDILKVAHLDKSRSTKVDDADILIAMVELMGPTQRADIKELAKQTGKHFVGLPNRGDWAVYLSHFPRPPRLAPVAPKSQPQPIVIPQVVLVLTARVACCASA